MAPSHFNTFPDDGGDEVVSTSDKKLILCAVILTVTFLVSVATAVAILVPPKTLNVSVDPDATAEPSSLVTVLNTSPAPPLPDPVYAITTLSPVIAVLISVPPSSVNESFTASAVVVPVSAKKVLKTVLETVESFMAQPVPLYCQVVVP